MHVLLLARRLKQTEVLENARRKLLQPADQPGRESDAAYRETIRQMVGDDVEEPFSEAALNELEGRIAAFEPISRSNYRYFLGELLSLQGSQERAEKLWREAVAAGPFDYYNVTLAGDRLSKLHGTSRPDAAAEATPKSPDADVEAAEQAEDSI
jgi:hypothetical protein